METMKKPIKVSSLIELLKSVHNQDAEVYITTAEAPKLVPLYADTLIMEVVDDEDMLIIDSNEYDSLE